MRAQGIIRSFRALQLLPIHHPAPIQSRRRLVNRDNDTVAITSFVRDRLETWRLGRPWRDWYCAVLYIATPQYSSAAATAARSAWLQVRHQGPWPLRQPFCSSTLPQANGDSSRRGYLEPLLTCSWQLVPCTPAPRYGYPGYTSSTPCCALQASPCSLILLQSVPRRTSRTLGSQDRSWHRALDTHGPNSQRVKASKASPSE